MSGIVAAIRTDGAPVDPALIHTLTAALAVRGPDAQTSRCLGSAAVGHALLRCGDESTDGRQPFTLDGDTWIVADARLDDRSTLAAQVGADAATTMSDAELLLRAFARWDADCVERLKGDFAFVTWTASRRRLFCGRDHFGVKPLNYARVGPWLLVGSAIDCLRMCREVSHQLDDRAVADFLLFGHIADADATTFRDIRRVPPAHVLTWTDTADVGLRRYWQFPIEEPLYLKGGEYREQVRALLEQSVADRSRTGRVAILMSGGLDSSVVAGTSARHLNGRIDAFTFVFRSLISDDEHVYAGQTARHLEVPWKGIQIDAAKGWDRCIRADVPEPFFNSADARAESDAYATIARHARVVFNGEGADNALTYEWQPYLVHLARHRRWHRLATDALAFVRHVRKPPLLRSLTGPWATAPEESVCSLSAASWLAPLAGRVDLTERWRHVMRPATSEHPTRPVGYFSLQLPLWQGMFDSFDPAYTGAALDVRYPFLDLRLLRFLMRVPCVPWCRDKLLLRHAFRHDLPDAVRQRQKSPMRGSPFLAKVRKDGLPAIRKSPRLELYGTPHDLDVEDASSSASAAEAAVRFAAFSEWLARLDSVAIAAD